jgi:hypothetical protein
MSQTSGQQGLLTGMLQLFGAFYTARCAARAFIKLGIKGAIVFTASMASYRPNKVCQPFGICLPFYRVFASRIS